MTEKQNLYEECMMCKENVPNNKIKTVIVQKGTVYRVCSVCKNCYQQCKSNQDYGEYISKYVFKNKLGKEYRVYK